MTTASVLIVAYRTPDLIDDCLKWLYAGAGDGDELVVVDNASRDGTVSVLERFGDRITLVALERNTVRGFAITTPSPDPDADPVADGEVAELTVDPEHTRQGHGSRLLHACVDTLRADRFTRAVLWVNSTDDIRRSFVTAAGWAADGAHRELDLRGDGEVLVKQVRLHTDLTEDA